jgi:hypothetical protein
VILHYLVATGHGAQCDPSIKLGVTHRLDAVTCRACQHLPPEPKRPGDLVWVVQLFGPTYLLMIIIVGTLAGQ